MLNLVSLSTQSLASCVNYFCLELFTVFFQHEYRFRYKFFRYCSIFKVLCAVAFRLTTWLFYHRSGFLSSTFFEKLLKFYELKSFSSFSVLTVSLSGWDPSILLSQDRSVCLNAPLGRFIAFATAKLFSVYWFFSKASCGGFESHSFASALGAQV